MLPTLAQSPGWDITDLVYVFLVLLIPLANGVVEWFKKKQEEKQATERKLRAPGEESAPRVPAPRPRESHRRVARARGPLQPTPVPQADRVPPPLPRPQPAAPPRPLRPQPVPPVTQAPPVQPPRPRRVEVRVEAPAPPSEPIMRPPPAPAEARPRRERTRSARQKPRVRPEEVARHPLAAQYDATMVAYEDASQQEADASTGSTAAAPLQPALTADRVRRMTRKDMRRAIILSEILAPPVALRD